MSLSRVWGRPHRHPSDLCPNLRFCTGGKNALGHILRPAALAAERRAERFGDGADVLRFGRQGKIPAVFARNEHQRQLCACRPAVPPPSVPAKPEARRTPRLGFPFPSLSAPSAQKCACPARRSAHAGGRARRSSAPPRRKAPAVGTESALSRGFRLIKHAHFRIPAHGGRRGWTPARRSYTFCTPMTLI